MNRLLMEYRKVGWFLFTFATLCLGFVYELFLSPTGSWMKTIDDISHYLTEYCQLTTLSEIIKISKALRIFGNGGKNIWMYTFLTSTSIYGIVYLGGLKLYEHWGWAKAPWNRRLDCNGIWYFRATKTVKNGNSYPDSVGTATIKQTALNIRISGDSTKTSRWTVQSIYYNSEFNGFLAYTAKPAGSNSGALDCIIGVATFKAEHIGISSHKKPNKIKFYCQEIDEKTNKRECIEITYARSVDELDKFNNDDQKAKHEAELRQAMAVNASDSPEKSQAHSPSLLPNTH